MANYDRRILIPYLQDVCSAELLCRKLEQELAKCRETEAKYTGWANYRYDDPPEPDWETYEPKIDAGFGCMVGGLWILGFMLIGVTLLGIPLGIPILCFALFLTCMMLMEYRSDEKNAEKKWNSAMEDYDRKKAQNKENREKQSQWRDLARQWSNYGVTVKNRLSEAQKLRDNLYSVNIIPARYRTIHATYYLYDYFSTCRESDLDKIIQTMLLEEIIQRMDKLIVQNQEIILNQRMQMAMQEQSNRMIAENHKKEMKQIARMERNQELQMDYQRMIATNQEVTNFFLAADYLRKN